MKRRSFFKSAIIGGPVLLGTSVQSMAIGKQDDRKLKLSLNTYSFNDQLTSGKTNLFELIDYCKDVGFEAIDPTGYYFSGYPNVPDDNVIYEFKRKAFLAGIEVSGTGVRNDFANRDAANRANDLKLIESWCKVASKLGAPLLRVFPGKRITDGRDKQTVIEQVISELKLACDLSAKYGVMLAMQNHNDFLLSSEEIEKVLNGVNSKWLGLHLDIGSFAQHDPYLEIEKLVKYAITWQIKEKVWINGQQVPVDYDQLMNIIMRSDYTGYLPLETLRTDPIKNLPKMIGEIRKRF